MLVHGGQQFRYEELGCPDEEGVDALGILKGLDGVSSLSAAPSCAQWKHLCVLEGISHSGDETPMSSL